MTRTWTPDPNLFFLLPLENNNAHESPLEEDVEEEGKINTTKRESASEMYVCELQNELWKQCVILNKEEKMELV